MYILYYPIMMSSIIIMLSIIITRCLKLAARCLKLGQERRILCPSPAAVVGFS